MLTIASGQYQEAFATTVALIRDRGWEPAFMDPRSGVIESDSVQAGSFIEPWMLNTEDFDTIVENTLSKTRTRVRIEFRPVGTASLARTTKPEFESPDYVARQGLQDLTRLDEPLDLRAWVYVEHGHRPDVMRSTWSPKLKSQPTRVGHDPRWEQPPRGVVWIPTSRDRSAERKLLAALEQALQADQPVQAESEPPTG
jgi:hypothetical protein